MTGPLARSYRILLLAYPRWYRRERAPEMLTTLLDAAPPGVRRPPVRDVVDLIAGGLRCRLRPPAGVGYRLILAAIALFGALAGLSAAGTWAVPGAPDTDEAVTAAGTAMANEQPHDVAAPTASCGWCPDWRSDAGAPLRRRDFVALAYTPRPADVSVTVQQAGDRLATAGWEVGPVTEDPDAMTVFLTATKDGLALSLTGQTAPVFLDKDLSRPDPAQRPLVLVVTRQATVATAIATVVGLLGGLLAGWLVAAWTLQRFRRHHRALRLAMVATGAPVLLVAVIADLLAANWLLVLTLSGNLSANYLAHAAALLPVAGPPAVAALTTVVALILVTVTIAGQPGPGSELPGPRRGLAPPGRHEA